MGVGTLIALGGSLVGTATDIYFNYNKKKQTESDTRIDSLLKLAEINQDTSMKNLQSRQKIKGLQFQNMNAVDDFSKSELKNDLSSQLKLGEIKSGYATSGVELNHSALDYLNAVEDNINKERAFRVSVNENEIASRGRMITTLLYDIDKNNILKEYQSEQVKLGRDITLNRLDNRFVESTISSVVSFGKKTAVAFQGCSYYGYNS